MPPTTQEILDAIESEDARRVLALASLEPVSARDLDDELDVSLTTIYRHTDEFTDLEFLTETTEITPDGDHYSSYETAVRTISFTVSDGEFEATVRFREDVVDRFSRLWRSLGDRSS